MTLCVSGFRSKKGGTFTPPIADLLPDQDKLVQQSEKSFIKCLAGSLISSREKTILKQTKSVVGRWPLNETIYIVQNINLINQTVDAVTFTLSIDSVNV